MTAMKNGLYALVAIVMGVMLVGLLPGQLSNLASPMVTLQATGGSPDNNITITGGGSAVKSTNDTLTAAEQEADNTGSKAQARATEGTAFVLVTDTTNPYNDLKYWGMMGAGLVIAFGVYFVSKRMLG